MLERKPEVFLSCIPFLTPVQGLSTESATVFSSALMFCSGFHTMIWKGRRKGRKLIRNSSQEEKLIYLVALCRTSQFSYWLTANLFSSSSLCAEHLFWLQYLCNSWRWSVSSKTNRKHKATWIPHNRETHSLLTDHKQTQEIFFICLSKASQLHGCM